MSGHVFESKLALNILKDMGITLPSSAKILDFGCGAGPGVYAYLEQGHKNIYGYDIKNYLKLKAPADIKHFFFSEDDCSAHKGTFDFVFSNQVFEHVMDYPKSIRQIHEFLKPGGVSVHFFPSKWSMIEPHIYVPLAGAISSKTYLDFWARLGIRNEFQQGKSWVEVSEENQYFCKNKLNYLNSQEIYRFFSELFDKVEFREDLFIKHSPGRLQGIPGILKTLPGLAFLIRNFHTRTVFLQKSSGEKRKP